MNTSLNTSSNNTRFNRDAWNYFLQQIDAQVEGNFLSLAAEYESIMGRPFQVPQSPQVLFSMLQQAMMSENKLLLTDTVDLIGQLPQQLQAEFALYSRHHPDGNVGESQHHERRHRHTNTAAHTQQVAKKLWDMLHLNRIA
ncbi:hypothetical protein ACVBE9_11695 [Eionea flava]